MQLRKTAEDLKLLSLHSVSKYDLSEIARILYNNAQGKEIIVQYFQEKKL